MKLLKIIPVASIILFYSCASINVTSDYDKTVDFNQYKTFAFHKSGIDKVEISDLDKKRILKAIDESLSAKGLIKQENPDILVNIFTKSREQVDVNTFNAGWGYGWGWGWSPWMYNNRTSVSRSTEGTLYIDLIDAKKKELIWQGEGNGNLPKSVDKKDEQIKKMVSKILDQYPPQKK